MKKGAMVWVLTYYPLADEECLQEIYGVYASEEAAKHGEQKLLEENENVSELDTQICEHKVGGV